MPPTIDRREGRRLFGRDPDEYDRVRADYPDGIYRALQERCGLRAGTSVFEIGAGTGKASRELLRRGADPLIAIEPDPRLARFLRRSLAPWGARVRVIIKPFEEVDLPEGSFDLGVAATSFHWLNERSSLRKVARLLRPGGWWAGWWNLSNDPLRPNRYSRAVDPLFRALPGEVNPRTSQRRTYLRGRARRVETLKGLGRFDRVDWREFHWARRLETTTLLGLHRTFSNISTLEAKTRRRFLTDLAQLTNREFGGRVTMRMLTTLYTARRRKPVGSAGRIGGSRSPPPSTRRPGSRHGAPAVRRGEGRNATRGEPPARAYDPRVLAPVV
jgi:SAM-dependent methyltransferase